MPIPLIIAGAAVGAAAISSSQQKKAAKNAEDLAREQQQTAIAEQKRLEEKYGLTPGELAREQRLFGIPEGEVPIKIGEGLEARRQTELERRAGRTGEELLREVGPETRRLLDDIAARQGKTGEELFREEGAIPIALQEQILAETREPTKFYEDTLTKQLELSRQMINAEANRRGVFGGLPEGGIRFENLGRAGVDLAIKSAQDRMAYRQQALANASQLSNLFQSLAAGARGEAGTVGERALSEKERARAELQDFLQLMEQASAGAKGRAAQVGTQASQAAQAQTGQAYSNLIGIQGYRGAIQGPAEAGLSAIGQIGADYLGEYLKSTIKKPTLTGDYGGGTLSAERQAGARYDPTDYLGEFTGGWERRKKLYGSDVFL